MNRSQRASVPGFFNRLPAEVIDMILDHLPGKLLSFNSIYVYSILDYERVWNSQGIENFKESFKILGRMREIMGFISFRAA